MIDLKSSIQDYAARPCNEVHAASERVRDAEYLAGAGFRWLEVSAKLAHVARVRGSFDANHQAADLASVLRMRAIFDDYYRHTQRLPG
ncbi:MAG: hypothetical protein SGI99_03840 [Pseudomonadota bacterium]|nr:hypothetical protein [Pseudomonadota bacterium]